MIPAGNPIPRSIEHSGCVALLSHCTIDAFVGVKATGLNPGPNFSWQKTPEWFSPVVFPAMQGGNIFFQPISHSLGLNHSPPLVILGLRPKGCYGPAFLIQPKPGLGAHCLYIVFTWTIFWDAHSTFKSHGAHSEKPPWQTHNPEYPGVYLEAGLIWVYQYGYPHQLGIPVWIPSPTGYANTSLKF